MCTLKPLKILLGMFIAVILLWSIASAADDDVAANADYKSATTATGNQVHQQADDDISTLLVNSSSENDTKANTTTETTTLNPTTKEKSTFPPCKETAEKEHKSSLTIFFILLVLVICILIIHLLLQTNFHYLPESIAVVLIGALIGLVLKLFTFGNWRSEEAFSPTIFFIILLPPIIFESGYNLHKGNFFQNIGSILVFAIIGTLISAVIVGGGVYLLGQMDVAYKFTVVESFAFGSLISAVDPVATLAIFHALDVDQILYMLVFGESILNDAVAITLTTPYCYTLDMIFVMVSIVVLCYIQNHVIKRWGRAVLAPYNHTALEFKDPDLVGSGAGAFFHAVWRFCLMFFASSAIGVGFGLTSALLLKFIDLRKTPSLEIGMMLAFSYLPYSLAEGLQLSGIMAILFCGVVMSHYTHLNLSPVAQITVQQLFRTIAFIAETCMFAYLGLAIFSFKLDFKPALVLWSIALILIGRAVNIFPLSFILNYFREHKITRKTQFIMWFSGLRGAIAFALSLQLESSEEKSYVLVTTTLIIVLFTVMFLGGATMPLMKFLKAEKKKKKKKSNQEVSLSKTKEMGETVDSEHLSEMTEEEIEVNFARPGLKGFLRIDVKYLKPFFTRRFTQQEVKEGRIQMDHLTNKWYQDVRAAPSESESEEEEETLFINAQQDNRPSASEPLIPKSTCNS